MTTYIALLRGINVSGQKMIKMDHLKGVFESMKLHHVRTYIQSRNVLFESPEGDAQLLTKRIEQHIESAYSFQVTVILRTLKELEEIIRQCPYKPEQLLETDSLYVSFLSELPSSEAIDKCMALQNDIDEFAIADKEVYILIHKKYGETKFSNNFLEKKLKVTATTRNWATVNKLVSLGRG
ncbi:DUF1697 domain-containing protein [Cohnella silvisoli]|uniref:DUF1697 domain-containing protein n=1 Tax=Cohnella silvisoli TaxID=2873699 RepID=A0ABV1L1K4_9BACL|nr:DUF1697 domain-containing protein [Cohnella silvisoli]MCD9025491.1 DUF1697 domain-containing protein [Cohnella silvisoli]